MSDTRLEALVSQFGVTVSKYVDGGFAGDLDNFPLDPGVEYSLHIDLTIELNKRGWSLGNEPWKVTVVGNHIELTHRVWDMNPNRGKS